MKWIENEELFKRELTKGYKWQLYVASFLRDQGFQVDIPALKIRKDLSEIPKFVDEPDLLWEDKLFEVKSRKLYFTCPADFPYRNIFVDTVYGWQDKARKPDGYICISTKTKAIICLSKKTWPKWTRQRKTDRTRGTTDYFYEASKSLWVPISTMTSEMNSLLDSKIGE